MIKFPFTTLQQCNLDWIMQKLHEILKFMPMNGSAGDVLQRNVDGAAWMPISAVSLDIHSLNTIPDVEAIDELPIYDNSQQGNFKITVSDLMDNAPVQSVNGQTGTVSLSIPTNTSDLNNDSGFITSAQAPVQSVNGQTGTVTLSIPTDTSDLNNDSGFITAGQAPVQSVNGQTGAVTIAPTDFRSFTEYYPYNGDVTLFTSDDVSNLENELTVAVSDNKKFIRVGGFMSFDTGATSGWKYIRLGYTAGDLHFDFTPPPAAISVMYPAILFDENKIPIFQTDRWNTRFNVNASGAIVLAFYVGGTTPGLRRYVALPSVLFQTAL